MVFLLLNELAVARYSLIAAMFVHVGWGLYKVAPASGGHAALLSKN